MNVDGGGGGVALLAHRASLPFGLSLDLEAGAGFGYSREASGGEFWRELWVAAPVGDHLIEGYVDLLYRSLGGLVIVDWKTDHVDGDDDVRAKLARYRLQGASYAAAVEAATGEPVHRVVFAFLREDGAVEAELDDLPAAMAEVRARTAELAVASATIESISQLG